MAEQSQSSNLQVRLSSILTLGYLCEDLSPETFSQDELNKILGSLLSNVFPENVELTSTAMQAFRRASHCTGSNFQNPQMRQYIMDNVFKALSVEDDDVQEDAMGSLVEMAKVNYDYLSEYIMQIGNLTS